MLYLDKVILVTNNDRAMEKYRGRLVLRPESSYEQVLLRCRAMLHQGHTLLTHPQASSLKPNQTPYRSVLLYPGTGEDNTDQILLMEKCLEVYYSWQSIAPTPARYEPRVEEDFKTIDLSTIDGVIGRL